MMQSPPNMRTKSLEHRNQGLQGFYRESCNSQFLSVVAGQQKPLQVIACIKISLGLTQKPKPLTCISQFPAFQGKPALSKLTMFISQLVSSKHVPNDAKHSTYECQVVRIWKTAFTGILQGNPCNSQFYAWS